MLRVGGRGPGLLPALLHGVQDPELIGDGGAVALSCTRRHLFILNKQKVEGCGCPQCGSDMLHNGVLLADGWL